MSDGHQWPGNVRELENAIEARDCDGRTAEILPDDLPGEIVESTAPPSAEGPKFHQTIREVKRLWPLKTPYMLRPLMFRLSLDVGGLHHRYERCAA